MQIIYHEADDILFIKFNADKIVRDVSHGWNVHIGYTENGIGEITILGEILTGCVSPRGSNPPGTLLHEL